MPLFRTISIDDTASDAKRLADLLASIETVEYLGNAPLLADGRELMMREHPDLIFLDVDLPDGNGLEAIKELKRLISWPAKIVVHTVYDHLVLEALRQEAYDYLVKPVKASEMQALVARLEEDYELRAEALDVMPSTERRSGGDLVMVNSIVGYVPLRYADIVYADHVDGTKYWQIHLIDGTSQYLRRGTSSVNILDMDSHFIQVNNHQIINLMHLAALKKEACVLVAPYREVEVPVTRSYLPALQSRMTFV
jgi:two-component system LytT family response regulator